MRNKLILAIICLSFTALAACGKPTHPSDTLAMEWQPKSVAILPYQLGIVDANSNRAHSPLTGAVYRSGEITVTAQVVMDQILQNAMEQYSNFSLEGRQSAARVFDRLRVKMPPKQAVVETGRELGVDAVVIGYIYRFTQRVGEDFGVESPASAAFDLCVIRVSDGLIVWRNSFDHTQTSLSQNLLEAGQFISHGLKWFTVEQFAEYGMEQLLESLPWKPEEQGAWDPQPETTIQPGQE